MEGKEVISLIQNPAFLVIIAWAFREWWHASRKDSASMKSEHTLALKENTAKLMELTVSLVRLEVKIEIIEKLSEKIPEMTSDINALHAKVRMIAPIGS